MEKFDKTIIEVLSKERKLDSQIANALSLKEKAIALVRVKNPLHLIALERRFNVVKEYPFIRSLGIECGVEEAIILGRMTEVEYVSGESRVSCLDNANFTSNTSDFDEKNGYSHDDERILSFSRANRLTGRGVTLCVMDTGVSPHSDLSVPRDRILHFVDVVGQETEPYDDNGHGTFVSGIAVGNGLLSGGSVHGVAPDANIVGIKVIGENGESGTFKILDGMQWLFDNFRTYNINVVCMSFGAEPLEYADPLKIGAEMLARSGLIVVAASGNSGENHLKSPAISNEIISVGAVDENNEIADFTSRGTYAGAYRPDVYAKGVNVKGIKAGATYSTMTGTSASAPYIAGACCLLCEKYRNITPKQAKSLIFANSKNINGNIVFDLSD